MQVNIDLFGPNGSLQGPLAGYLAEQGQINPAFMRPILGGDGHTYFTVYKGGDRAKPESYHTYRKDQLPPTIQVNGTLRRDEWKTLDQAVLAASRIRLGAVQDLLDNNLVYNLTDPMASTVLEHHRIKEAMTADVDISPEIRANKDRVTYDVVYTPIPIIHADFSINPRTLAASRKMGNPLDTDMVQEATRAVLEKREEMLVGSSTSITFGGGSVFTYLTHSDRNQYSLTGAWTGLTGEQILADVLAMMQMSIDDRKYGPWMLYIPTAYQAIMGKNFVANYPGSIRTRLMELDGLKGIKVIDKLAANQVLLVEMTTGTVRLINGMGIQVVQWQVGGSLSPTEYKVLAIQVPEVRSDANGHCGVVHGAV